MCSNCKHEFVYSFHSFDILPLVEFYPEDDISDEEARKLIEREPPLGKTRKGATSESVQTLSLDNQETFENDLFGSLLDQYEVPVDCCNECVQQEGRQGVLKVNRDVLLGLKKTEVFIRKWVSPSTPTQYYRLMVPEIPVVLCSSCNHFFHEDDYEIASIQKRRCPLCRVSSDLTL